MKNLLSTIDSTVKFSFRFRPVFLLSLLIVIFIFSGCTHRRTAYMRLASKGELAYTPNKNEATVFFMCCTGFGHRYYFSIFDITSENYKPVGADFWGAKVAYKTTPGRHIFILMNHSGGPLVGPDMRDAWNWDYLEANLTGGKTYFSTLTVRSIAGIYIRPIRQFEINTKKIQAIKKSRIIVELNGRGKTWSSSQNKLIDQLKGKNFKKWAQNSKHTRLKPEDGIISDIQSALSFGAGSNKPDYPLTIPAIPKYMVVIKSRKFNVRPFLIDESEVTQRNYREVMGANPSFFEGPHNPVENVTHSQAKQYCGKVEKRLPTKIEWVAAAHADTSTLWSFGPDIKFHYKYLNYCGGGCSSSSVFSSSKELDGWPNVAPVKSFKPNPWGLYDMHGNVAEYVQKGPARGGSWKSRLWETTSMASYNEDISNRDYIGFRCAKSIE